MVEQEALVARPAASAEQLVGYAKVIARWLAMLEGDGGCSICGMGPHVERCPVPALRAAHERLAFMASVPVMAGARTRGCSLPHPHKGV